MGWQSEWHCCHSSCWIWLCCCILNYAHAQELSRNGWTNVFVQEGSNWAADEQIIPSHCGKWPSSSWDHIVLCTWVEQQEVTRFDLKRVTLRYYVVNSCLSLSVTILHSGCQDLRRRCSIAFCSLSPFVLIAGHPVWVHGADGYGGLSGHLPESLPMSRNQHQRDRAGASWTWTPHPHGVNSRSTYISPYTVYRKTTISMSISKAAQQPVNPQGELWLEHKLQWPCVSRSSRRSCSIRKGDPKSQHHHKAGEGRTVKHTVPPHMGKGSR